MLSIEYKDGKLLVGSNYDTGTHIGFNVGFVREGDYGVSNTLDKLLSAEEIRSVEAMIASVVMGYLEEK